MAAPSKYAANRFLFGLGALGVLAVIFFIAFTANQQRLPWSAPTQVRAEFQNIGQLQTGSDVRQNGVPVGTVAAIDRVNGHLLVTMNLTRGVPMNRDGYAGIWDMTTLATKFVELRPGNSSSGPLGNSVLPLRQTESSHDLVQLLDVFDPPTRAALGNTLRQLGGVAGYGPGLHAYLSGVPKGESDLQAISASLVSDRADLPGFMRKLDNVETRFAGQEYLLNELGRQLDGTLRALSTENAVPLGQTVNKMPTALRTVRGALDHVKAPLADLASATGTLRPGARSLGNATPDVRGVFRESQQPLNKVPDFSDAAEPAVSDLTHTVSDLRPLMPRIGKGLEAAAQPLKVLKPYAVDFGTTFADLDSMTSAHQGWHHEFRALIAMPTLTSSVEVPVKDSAKMYEPPGRAFDRQDANGAFIPGDPSKKGR